MVREFPGPMITSAPPKYGRKAMGINIVVTAIAATISLLVAWAINSVVLGTAAVVLLAFAVIGTVMLVRSPEE